MVEEGLREKDARDLLDTSDLRGVKRKRSFCQALTY
jgi:hypothetical protein